jgi:prepilin-type N-terminal cleavage/methylation domain-containing protein/prepilin-type processing-associated H-X9-DG protein
MLRGRGAFTLAELLVVCAILSILAAIIFPVMTAAMDRSHRTVCVSNLREIGMALNLYEGDNNGRMPMSMAGAKPDNVPLQDWDGGFPGVGGLVVVLYSYCGKSTGIWMCPSGPTRHTIIGTASQNWSDADYANYTRPADMPVNRGSNQISGWNLVSVVRVPGGPIIYSNIISLPLNRCPADDSQIECALGRTPEDYNSRCGHVWSKGNPSGWWTLGSPRLNGRILQDAYPTQGGIYGYFHPGGTNVLYWDGRCGWVENPGQTNT